MQKSTFGFIGLFSALFTVNTHALDFKADLYTDLNALQSLHSVYGLSGKYATGFTHTVDGITMQIGYSSDTPPLKDPRSIQNPILGEFISLDHGFFMGHMEIPKLTADVATSFTIMFSSNVYLDSIFFDDIVTSRYKPNVPPQFTISGPDFDDASSIITTPPLQAVDVNTNHNINNSKGLGHVPVNMYMLANQPYTVTVIPVPGEKLSIGEFWKVRATVVP
jgi:hypothetical protein